MSRRTFIDGHDNWQLFTDESGDVEVERAVCINEEGESLVWNLYRVSLEQYGLDENAQLVNAHGHRPWFENDRHPLTHTPEFEFVTGFCRQCGQHIVAKLDGIAGLVGIEPDDLRLMLCDDSPRVRLEAYEAITAYYGWGEFDQYPLTLTDEELETRFNEAHIVPCTERPTQGYVDESFNAWSREMDQLAYGCWA